MKKTICLSLALLMSVAAFPLQAQDTTNEKNQPAPAQEDSAKEEESSIFSFFNFGSKDKKAEDGTTAKQAEAAPKETKIERLTKEADAGNLNSQMALGYIYLYGEDDTKPNPDKAFHYYKLAAEQNDNIAVNNLASLYYSGIGVEQNFAMAAELFRKAVQLGNTEAAVNLAFLYLAGSGVNKDSKEAINYFVIAAKAGNPTAQFMLGYAYFKGHVVPQDYARAFELMKASADAGYDDAQLILGMLYRDGQGTPQNYGKSITYLQKSLRQGNLDAMMMLANMLTGGVKVTPDYLTAHVLYNLSSVRGAPDAAEERNAIEQRLNVEQLLQAQAQADSYREKPSSLTQYIRQTFGQNIKAYIDAAAAKRPATAPKPAEN